MGYRALFASTMAATLIAAAPAGAAEPPETVYGVIDVGGQERLATTGTTSGLVTTIGPIGGLNSTSSEKIVSMDFRPATGQLYALTSDEEINLISGINTANPAATPITSPLPMSGTGDIDFNPVTDTIRVVSTAANNLRVNPSTAAVLTDANLTGGTGGAGGAAYTNPVAGSQQTTLYDISVGALYLQGGMQGAPSPNSGVLTNIGSLGASAEIQGGGFDISPNSGQAVTLRTDAGVRALLRVNLATGAATTISNPVDATLHAITVRPEQATMSFTASSAGVAEDAGSAALTVRRSGNLNAATSAGVTTNAASAGGSDFASPSPATVSFAAGETTKTVSIPIANDSEVESDESFTVFLGSPVGGTLGSPSTSTVTIFDDDPVTTTQTETVTVPVTVTGDQVLLIDAPPSLKRKALARGLKLRASCAEACEVAYELRLGSKVIGTASGIGGGAGIHAVTLKLSKAGAEALADAFGNKKKKVKLILDGTATDSDGGAPSSDSVSLTIRR